MIGFGESSARHLGESVADYVDGTLTPQQEQRADLHLTICEHCRHEVLQERDIIARLREVSFDSDGHPQLIAGLLSLATTHAGGRDGAAPGQRPAPAVVTVSAPPQYQSARRSMACALVAVAGCLGVALVASTATGAANGPQPAPAGDGKARANLVRQAPGSLTPASQGTVRPASVGSLITPVGARSAR